MIKVLLVNHNLSKFCGIKSHGIRMGNILKQSKNYNIEYVEANSYLELQNIVENTSPKIIIYNYTQNIMGWALDFVKNYKGIIHIGMGHDVPQQLIDRGVDYSFDYRVALDPTLTERNNWFTTVRPLFSYRKQPESKITDPITIGSFGFYFEHKNFEYLLDYCMKTYPNSKLRFKVNEAYFSSLDTKNNFSRFKQIIDRCKKTYDVDLDSQYSSDEKVIDFLSSNDINVFFYSPNVGMGPGSAIDYAVAAGRPVLLSKSYQFRHVLGRLPTFPEYNILEALSLGNAEIMKIQDEWSETNFIRDYERILNEVQD